MNVKIYPPQMCLASRLVNYDDPFGPWESVPLEAAYPDDDFYVYISNSLVHKLSTVDPTAILLGDNKVWAFTTICKGVVLGCNVVVGGRCYIGKESKIGQGTRIQDGCHITDRMIIGDRCFFGPGVVTMNDRHPVVNNPNYIAEPPTIGNDVTIGAGVVIYPGVAVGDNSVIAAGAVVTRDIPWNSVVMIKDRLMITSKGE